MQLNIHDSTLKRIGFINNDLPDALHYFNDNWHRYLAEGTSTFDFSVNKVNPDYALLTLQSYISFSYDDEDYLFNIINIQQDHSTMQIQCENLNLELISEEVGAYSNTKRHSIVWYLKNAAKITANVVEIGNNPFSTIDEDTSNPILSFDSTETKLARIISICNSFKAEFQFKTNLKDDGTLQNITLDLYQTGGVGQLRKDVTLYYGKNIDGITSTGDRTATFFNSTTVTDSNNKYNWISIEGKYYNSDGQLEFYKDAGSNTAYAPLSRDMFPSQILSTSSDQYTNKNIQTSASSNDDLWDYAVSQFKLYAYPQMTYEVIVSVNAVTSALGNDKKLNIGDTIIVQDSTFDKSDGGLILSARVSEQEISFTNPLNNKITFTNFVKLKSEISADLYGRMKDLVDQNTPYRSELETTNGVQFKNSAGSTTLTARIYFGSDSTETKADSYSWTKDGTLVANVQEITVDASGIDGKAVYAYKATVNEKVVGSQSVTITNVDDGTSPINLVIDSSNGYQFKNNIINTTFTAILYQNNKEIDSDGTKFAYIWSKTNPDGTVDTAWNLAHQTSQKSITITNSDVWQRATFDCTAEPLN
ncbi:Phage tail assembly [Sphingobacterium faecium PCAi_F2.5]|nr:Phage tail assembly [Sphingobacterium faecium PCAi_F2.5]